MAKINSFYFDHDYGARNDDKIMELRSLHGAEGYGVFWMIVETMASNDNGGVKATLIGGLSHGYGVAKGRLQEIIASCLGIGLFYESEGTYYSKRVLKHKEFRQSLSGLGKQGAEKRWGNVKKKSESIAPLKPPYSDPNANKSKVKERKEEIPFGDGTLVSKMVELYKQYFTEYFEDIEKDPVACLKIARKIAKKQGWLESSVTNGKIGEVLGCWGKIVLFCKSDTLFKNFALQNINNQFQLIDTKMSNGNNSMTGSVHQMHM